MVDLLILWIICRGASKSNKKQITRNKQETNKKGTNNNLKEKLFAYKIYILIIILENFLINETYKNTKKRF